MTPKILFLLKKRQHSWNDSYSGSGLSSGLYNSANFIKNMLIESGFKAKLAEVIDGNGVDREIHIFRPTHVIIEAFFVTPVKLSQLAKLHPKIQWIVRNHSDFPFLSTEGIVMDWSLEYLKIKNVYLSCNKKETNNGFKVLAKEAGLNPDKVLYLPNYYMPDFNLSKCWKDSDVIKISCFGAIRPIKNQLIQAIAAIQFAKKIGKRLEFHINSGRVEGRGEPTLKSIKTLFAHLPCAKLVEHGWTPHHEFKNLCGKMDIAMQVSFSETLNIVSCDSADQNVPIVVSEEIFWACRLFQSKTTKIEDIIKKLSFAWKTRKMLNYFNPNKYNLKKYSELSRKIWIQVINS